MAELGGGPFLHDVTIKTGLVGLIRSLAREVEPESSRVNCVMPGAIQTEREIADIPDQVEMATFLADPSACPSAAGRTTWSGPVSPSSSDMLHAIGTSH